MADFHSKNGHAGSVFQSFKSFQSFKPLRKLNSQSVID